MDRYVPISLLAPSRLKFPLRFENAITTVNRPSSKSIGLRRLGILGSPHGPYVRELVAAAQHRHSTTTIDLISFAELAVTLDQGRVAVVSRRAEAASAPPIDRLPERIPQAQLSPIGSTVDLLQLDGLVVRTMPVGSLEQVIFRMDALQAVMRAGVPILNPPGALEIAIDKWLTLERLSSVGIATPLTVACQSRQTAMDCFELLGRDVVVKPIFGGEGRGIVRVTDADMAWRVFGTLQQLGAVLYVQQFLPHFGYDIRVLMIGPRLLSVKRWALEGNWRTNLAQGCRAEPHVLSSAEEDLARAAAQATGGTLLGIDLLPTLAGQTVVLEVNAVPGWKGTAAALGINVADLVIEHLEDLHAERT